MGRKRRKDSLDEPHGLPSDMEDEVDAFASAKDKVALELLNGDEGNEASEGDEAILDIEEDSSEDIESEELEESEAEEEPEESSEPESDAEEIGLDELERDIQQGGEIGELAKQAKAVRQLLMRKGKAADGTESDSDGEDSLKESANLQTQWGGTEQYYGTADGKEADIDEEILDEEEEEVVKLQAQQFQSMKEDDFMIGGTSSDEDDGEDEKGATMDVEAVPRDLTSIPDAEKAALLTKQAPELMALCTDLKESLSEFRQRIGPLVKEAREGGLCENEGLSYLEVKHHLLLHYCICILFYMTLKLEGKPVKDHPVVLRLIEIRAFLEKIRPIDARLQYQVDKLLRAAQMAKSAANENGDQGEDGLQFAPRPDALMTSEMEENENGDGLYKPPRLNPIAMEQDKGASIEKQKRRDERKRAAQSELVDEMVQELTGAPEEVHDKVPGWDTAKAIRALKKMENRSKIEEEMFTRVHLTKDEKKRMKGHRHRAGMSGGAALADFADDVRDTLNAIDSSRGSQHFATHTIPQKVKPKSGDEDLPVGESFWDRKKRIQESRNQKMENWMDSQPDAPEEDGPVKAARQAKLEKKAKKKAQSMKHQQTKPPAAPPTVQGPRGISMNIQKNRGLTPNRRRDIKNPRKRQRLRYEVAQKKRGGMVQNLRTHDDVYGGEATGIKKNVSKSVRFK